MNKAYKVVYNESTGTYVAVSELETSQGKSISSVENASGCTGQAAQDTFI